jgi:hypothetical protein
MTNSLYTKLLQAEIVCRDCGMKYGKYSVGCSSTWEGNCDVCGEHKGVTEVRDWGYLSKGLAELGALKTDPFAKLTESFPPERKAKIKEQSKVVASYIASVGPIMTDPELEDALTASYERGDLTLKLTEEEVGFLNECLDVIQEHHLGLDENDPIDVALFESIEKKITELYADYCIKYELSPALKAYNEKYNTWGTGEDEQRWDVFKAAFEAGASYSSEQGG